MENNVDKPVGYISNIEFNNGKTVEVKQNDIVIFVGPNNAGKSQALRDIYELSYQKQPSIVIKDIKIQKDFTNMTQYLESISKINNSNGSIYYEGLKYNIYKGFLQTYINQDFYDELRSIFMAYLNTMNRLTICEPADNITRNSQKSNPIHYPAFEEKYAKWLSENFKKAFGKELIPNINFGLKIPLCIGDAIKFNKEFESEQTRQLEYGRILSTYKQVQDQGDGIKSFTGILLYLMLKYNTYLIDEPESFLHPPQANIMGQIIGKTLSENQQAFISTHSQDFIKGLLDVCPERIKIIRVTRDEDNNDFSILDNEKFKEVWNDPLLKYSNIMSSLFHKTVVLCESDSDCRMYSIIENNLKISDGKYSETLFIHCGGKHRMAKIAKALRALNINVKLIPDIDVLDNEEIFRGIVEAFGIDWSTIEKDYKSFVSNLHSDKENINRNDVKTTINRILNESNNVYVSKDEIKEIGNAIKTISKWSRLKESGFSALPRGEAKNSFDNMNDILKNHNIFIVPVGELECFIKEVGGHGPEWTNEVLEKYPDINDSVYNQIKDFIRSLNL